jgi:hypothetical protein
MKSMVRNRKTNVIVNFSLVLKFMEELNETRDIGSSEEG